MRCTQCGRLGADARPNWGEREDLPFGERFRPSTPVRGKVIMPIELLHGRPVSPEELEMLRQQIEEGFDNIVGIDDEIRGIVARNWPYLLSKLPPVRERIAGERKP